MSVAEIGLKAELYELLRHCTVRVYGANSSKGTGFFVAPGLIITSAHLLQGDENTSFTVEWQDKLYGARINAIHSEPITGGRKRDWPDLAVLELELDTHPCVVLGTLLSVRDPVYTFGFSDENSDGDPVTITFEGFSGERRMLKLKSGQIRPGLSGAPILNERTGEVVGILQLTRDRSTYLGGYGTSVATLLECEPDLAARNRLFHLADDRWLRLLPSLITPIHTGSRFSTSARWYALTLVMTAVGIAIVSVPTSWHRLLGTTAVILPLTSSEPVRAQTSEDLTQRLSEEWQRESGIETIGLDLVRPMAATLSYSENSCVPMEVLDRIRRFTGAAYVINGSFETFKDQQPKKLRLCVQSTWSHYKYSSTQHDLVPEAQSNPLNGVARRISQNIRMPLRAIPSLKKDRVTEDSEAVRLYFEGVLHLQRYELQAAVGSFDSAINRDPRFYPSYSGLSRVWQELGHDGKAQDAATKALTLFGHSEGNAREWTLLQSSALGTQGKWKLAIKLYQGLWHRDRSDMTAAVRLAEAQNLGGRSEDALKTIMEIRGYQKARSIDIPMDIDAKLDVEESIAHHFAGDFAMQRMAAVRAWKKAGLDHDLLKSRALYLECDALVSQNLWSDDCDQAADTFNEGGDFINYAKFLQLRARRLLLNQKVAEALLVDREVAQIFWKEEFHKGYIEQMSNLAYSLAWQNPPQNVEAELLCDKAVEAARASRNLNLPAVLINCAYFSTLTDRLPKAEEMYKTGLEMARKRHNLWLEAVALANLAYVIHGRGREDDALRLYQSWIHLSKQVNDSGPEFGETLIRYARLLSDLGRTTEARGYYKMGLGEMEGIGNVELVEFLASMTQVLGQSPRWQRLTEAYRLAER